MGVLDSGIVNVAVPSIQRQMHASFAEVQLVIAGYTLAYGVFLVTGGRLGDLYGHKRWFLLGMGSFTCCSALCSLAPSAWLLIVFRVLQGTTAALMTPQVISFLQVSFDSDERPLAFGSYAAIIGLAAVLGQVFGGFLLEANLFNLGWRTIFLINLPIGIIALCAALLLLPELRMPEAGNLDYGGVVLLTLALFLLIFPLVLGEGIGWPLWILLCLLLSIPCLGAFLIYEMSRTKRGKTPLVSFALFRHRRFPAGILTSMLAAFLNGAVAFLLAIYLQTMLHLSPLQAGLVFLSGSASFILASSLGPIIHRRLGARGLPVAAILVSLSDLLTLLVAQVLISWWGLAPLVVAQVISGFGMGLLSAPLINKTLEKITPSAIGSASGIYTTASQLAAGLGVALIGLLFSLFTTLSGEPVQAFVSVMLVVTLLSAGLLFLIRFLNSSARANC
ncbi:MFS transporter [Ktedonosporobacter rubrisoli]|uniref:MFS transporter n=1 Tax=Ktedonosporobacter rubrisoli TaxID=2509675 RepID=A0A4P6JJY7_KTERU|nr:MFS transporter [Ktedonosporobacter rubrisoli]QBD75455.1 MFS transporter [Ktedonosporobacter rubrisoli]